MDIVAHRLSTSGLAKVFEVPQHVVDIPIRERRGLEGRVHMNEPTTRFPSAQGNATLGFVRGALDVFEIAAQSRGGGGVGAWWWLFGELGVGSTLSRGAAAEPNSSVTTISDLSSICAEYIYRGGPTRYLYQVSCTDIYTDIYRNHGSRSAPRRISRIVATTVVRTLAQGCTI